MKKWLFIVLSLVLLLAVVFVGISVYLGFTMTRCERIPLADTPASFGLAYEDVSFPSAEDGLTLSGWLIPSTRSDRVVIMVHGADDNRADSSIGMLDIAAGLVDGGWSVLMFDLRGHGESAGERFSAGYLEQRDIRGAVTFAESRGFTGIALFGFSMGAVSSLLAAPEAPAIDAVVSDSAYADLADIMEPQFAERTSFPSFFLHPLLVMVKLMFGVDFTAVKPVEAVPSIAPRPVFFIHGDADEVVPVAHAGCLLEASENPEDIVWIVPGAEHVRSYYTVPEEYLARVLAFLESSFGAAP